MTLGLVLAAESHRGEPLQQRSWASIWPRVAAAARIWFWAGIGSSSTRGMRGARPSPLRLRRDEGRGRRLLVPGACACGWGS
jgi:hypothetical protein